MGNEVRIALDGPRALAVAETFAPQIILLDIGLPGMDGYEVARRLRKDKRFNTTVLAALTGYGSPEDRRKSESAGFNAHLVKPLDLDALQQLLAIPEALWTDHEAEASSGGRS